MCNQRYIHDGWSRDSTWLPVQPPQAVHRQPTSIYCLAITIHLPSVCLPEIYSTAVVYPRAFSTCTFPVSSIFWQGKNPVLNAICAWEGCHQIDEILFYQPLQFCKYTNIKFCTMYIFIFSIINNAHNHLIALQANRQIDLHFIAQLLHADSFAYAYPYPYSTYGQ